MSSSLFFAEQNENDNKTASSSKEPKGENGLGNRNSDNTKSVANRITDNGKGDSNDREQSSIASGTLVDSQTLVSQTQDRMWRALKLRYQYDSTLKHGQEYLRNHVNSKISLAVIYADLVGSTNMIMTLPVDKVITIIRAFHMK
jgi:hypothetical protein